MLEILRNAIFLLISTNVCFAADFPVNLPKGKVVDDQILEASGLAVSRTHGDVLYTHNDHGDVNRFFAVNINTGAKLATFTVSNVDNYDWEDLTYGPCYDDCRSSQCSVSVKPSRYCIYISETGDHHGAGARNNIYMVREPVDLKDQNVTVVDTLRFNWTEPDCETLMIDPTGQLYIISKVDNGGARMAALPDSAWGGQRVMLDMAKAATCKVFTTHNDPQGGDISPDGKEMVLVFEDDVYYYNVPDGDFIKAVNTTNPLRLEKYLRFKSTEAIAWDPQGMGFYTLPEGAQQTIYYHPKSASPGVGK